MTYGYEKIDEFFDLYKTGMSANAAGRQIGVNRGSAQRWAAGKLPKDYVARFPEQAERHLAVIEAKKAKKEESKELFAMAMQEGLSIERASRIADISKTLASKWATCGIPGLESSFELRKPRVLKQRKQPMVKDLYAPPPCGPFKGYSPAEIENALLRAVLADLKAEGLGLDSISNKRKYELGERLKKGSGLRRSEIMRFLKISRSSYNYWRRKAKEDPAPKRPELKDQVRRAFEAEGGARGYRVVWARLKREGVRVSEKIVRRLMRELGLVARGQRRRRRYSSYGGELSAAPKNLLLGPGETHCFKAEAPNRLWVTDITEFRLGGKKKVYLSAVIDCFDGWPVAWSIGLSPTSFFANESLLKACATLSAEEHPIIHSDRGSHYRWDGWIDICERYGLTRSMSRLGTSADNARAEGFFGTLKREFFYERDWREVTVQQFMELLDRWLENFRTQRIRQTLDWLTPYEYRQALGYAL